MAPTTSHPSSNPHRSTQLLESTFPLWPSKPIPAARVLSKYIPSSCLQHEWLISPVTDPTHTGSTAGTHSCRRHREIIHRPGYASRVILDTSYQVSTGPTDRYGGAFDKILLSFLSIFSIPEPFSLQFGLLQGIPMFSLIEQMNQKITQFFFFRGGGEWPIRPRSVESPLPSLDHMLIGPQSILGVH
jgi:hypothetical protein